MEIPQVKGGVTGALAYLRDLHTAPDAIGSHSCHGLRCYPRRYLSVGNPHGNFILRKN
jgi:hypothetical protein